MKRSDTITLICALFLSPLALASGRGAGNGGDVMTCRDAAGAITRIELLDYFEARTAGTPLAMGDPSLSVSQKIEIALQRLQRFGARRVEQYRATAIEFLNSAEFVRGMTLIDIPDERGAVIPAGCKLEQIAIQRTRLLLPSDRRLTINADLWDLLSSDEKAGLILHELLYGEALQVANGSIAHTPSIRALTGLFSSPQSDTLSLNEMAAKFDSAGLAWIGWNEAELMLFTAGGTATPPTFHPNGNLFEAKLVPKHAPFWHRVNSEIEFYCDEKCETLMLSPEGIPGYSIYTDWMAPFAGHVTFNRPGFVLSTGDRDKDPPAQVGFYKDGSLWQVSKAKAALDQSNYHIEGDESRIWFHPGGFVHSATAIRGWVKFDAQGKVEVHHALRIDHYGRVLEAYFNSPVAYTYQGHSVQLSSLLRDERLSLSTHLLAACFVAPETVGISGQKVQVRCIDHGNESSGYQPVYRSDGAFEIKRFNDQKLLIDGTQGFTPNFMCLGRDEVLKEFDSTTRRKKKTTYKRGSRLRFQYSGYDWVSRSSACERIQRPGWTPGQKGDHE
jgi:hypothetical protein